MSTILRSALVVVIVSVSAVARADFNDQARTMSNIFTYSNNITTANVLYSASKAQMRMYNEGVNAIEAHHAPLAATDFRPARAGHPLIEQWLASADAGAMAPGVRAIVSAFDRQLRRNNLATTAMLALETATYVLDRRTLSAEQEAPVLAAINDAIAASPALAKLGAADKQVMCDTLLLGSALMLQYEQAGNHDASVAVAREMMAALGAPR